MKTLKSIAVAFVSIILLSVAALFSALIARQAAFWLGEDYEFENHREELTTLVNLVTEKKERRRYNASCTIDEAKWCVPFDKTDPVYRTMEELWMRNVAYGWNDSPVYINFARKKFGLFREYVLVYIPKWSAAQLVWTTHYGPRKRYVKAFSDNWVLGVRY